MNLEAAVSLHRPSLSVPKLPLDQVAVPAAEHCGVKSQPPCTAVNLQGAIDFPVGLSVVNTSLQRCFEIYKVQFPGMRFPRIKAKFCTVQPSIMFVPVASIIYNIYI